MSDLHTEVNRYRQLLIEQQYARPSNAPALKPWVYKPPSFFWLYLVEYVAYAVMAICFLVLVGLVLA